MKSEQLDLNLLRHLQVLLREKNVTRASAILQLSQSATSSVLRRLRMSFEDPLLVRNGRALELTPYAKSLVQSVDTILELTEAMVTSRPQFDAATAHRTFTIMGSDYAFHVVGPPLLAALSTAAPAVRLNLVTLDDTYSTALEKGDVDLLFLSESLRQSLSPRLEHALLFSDRFVCCGWAGNEAFREPVTVQAMEHLPYAEYGPRHMISLADRGLEAAGIVTSTAVRTESQLAVPAMLFGTPLVAHLPERLALASRKQYELRISPPCVELPDIAQSVAWHPSKNTDEGMRWLITILFDLGLDASPESK